MHRVVITGMGWITQMGQDIESVWKVNCRTRNYQSFQMVGNGAERTVE